MCRKYKIYNDKNESFSQNKSAEHKQKDEYYTNEFIKYQQSLHDKLYPVLFPDNKLSFKR
jgi:hypothetical protein